MADAPQETAADGTRIKSDPDAEALPPPPPPAPLGQPLSDPSIAAARAQQMVEKKFGGGNQQRNGGLPGLMLPTPKPPQTDGPDDIPIDLSRHNADEEIRRIVLEGDEIRTQEDAIGEALRRFNIQTDVLQERPLNKKKRKVGKANQITDPISSDQPGPSVTPKLLQTDGPDMDEDAINSDLDDTDEEPVDDDDDGEGIPQIMLCMYDKVQRTKNKWKCVLKDGILTVNGKEYVSRCPSLTPKGMVFMFSRFICD
ncbi:hypothetical protein ABW19_dt0202888 [Dactylella cylindrospora]|nr:hypothetical protein ABW19_dt0202888 [Dactylella cylindrospora]